MKLAFAGTPEFAATALAALTNAGLPPALVLTQPDRHAGRGMRLRASPVKQFALARGWEIIQPASLRLEGAHAADAQAARTTLQTLRPDVIVVAAYGLILPAWMLALPRLGCINIHASLLPRWRGAAPIQRAIEAGDAETGITIMQMAAGLDTGDTLLSERVPIGADCTAASLHDTLAALGGRLIVEALPRLERGKLHPRAQVEAEATYAPKIAKQEAALDWRQPAEVLERRIRAFDPFPGASTIAIGQALKVWRARVEPGTPPLGAVPGQVLDLGAAGIVVACGRGVLRLTELQRAGGKRLPVQTFVAGASDWRPGLVLAATEAGA